MTNPLWGRGDDDSSSVEAEVATSVVAVMVDAGRPCSSFLFSFSSSASPTLSGEGTAAPLMVEDAVDPTEEIEDVEEKLPRDRYDW